MSVQQVDVTFDVRTKAIPGAEAASFLAEFISQLTTYDNSFELHEFSFKISFRTIWLNVEEANKHVARFIRDVMTCLGESHDITEDQIQIDFRLDGRDLSKEVVDLVVRTSTIKQPTSDSLIRNTNPYGMR